MPLKPKLQASVGKTDCFELEDEFVIFNGHCDECVPYCEALCCQVYRFVELTEEEAKSGRYQYIEETPGCDCENCTAMREVGLRYSLTKTPDHRCVNLDDNNLCSIYEIRPQACRVYNCAGRILPFQLEV